MADSFLPIENRSGRLKLDQEGDEEEERGENRQESKRDDHPLYLFDRSMDRGLAESLFKEKPARLQILVDNDLFLDLLIEG